MRIFTLAILLLSMLPAVCQQRKVTPVDIDDEKPAQPTLHYYDKHGNALKEPVLFLAELDTVQNVNPGPVYPLLNSVSVGLNFFDLAMKAVGQKYCSLDVWGTLSLHNWFMPVVEAGIGFANNTPVDGNYSYKCRPSFYIKAGIDYNFLYKSNPDYQAVVGLRGAYTSFGYDVDNISISSDYWGEQNNFSIAEQRAHALYGQALAGVRVKIWENLSLGWTARYSFKFNVSDGTMSSPWFIPGYGAKSNPLSATFSVIYTIPLAKNFELPIDNKQKKKR